jgi:predicted metalloprotease
MEWQNTPESSNIEDRRGDVSASMGGGGGGGGGFGTGGMGIGVILVVLIISYFTGINPAVLLQGAQVVTGSGHQQVAVAPQPARNSNPPAGDARTLSLIKHVLGETEAVWAEVLPAQKGVRYVPATLVLYTGATRSGCGGARAAMGPFYCPVDKKVYLDLSFFDEMRSKYGGGGDFAYAYVISHEIGHHVQDLLGILDKTDEAKQSVSRTQANAISVRVELMADCLAGVWAANANKKWKLIDQGDVQEALATAQAIGDDTLQKAARGYAVPDSFTHGSAAMRQKWLTTGLQSGQVDSCDTGVM